MAPKSNEQGAPSADKVTEHPVASNATNVFIARVLSVPPIDVDSLVWRGMNMVCGGGTVEEQPKSTPKTSLNRRQ